MKRTCHIIVLTLLAWVAAGKSYAQSRDVVVQQIIDRVSIDSLTLSVRELSGDQQTLVNGSPVRIYTRRYQTPGNGLAKVYLEEKLRRYGLSVELQAYDTSNPTTANVIAVQPGVSSPNRTVIVCAHYDNTANADTIPGADDNASGTAAVLEAARILSKFETKTTVVYALWNEEEIGLVGSYQYASRSSQRRDSIVSVVNLDMLGWDSNNDNRAEVHANTISSALADTLAYVNRTYGIGLAATILRSGTSQSDHSSFWRFGYSAVLLIEAYYGGELNSYLHTAADKFQYINVPFFHRCSKLAIGAIATLASVQNPTSLEISGPVPRELTLQQNYPNPFNPATSIRYSLPQTMAVQLTVFNTLGQQVAILADGVQEAGYHEVKFDGSNLSSGMYLYRLQAGDFVQTRKLLLLR